MSAITSSPDPLPVGLPFRPWRVSVSEYHRFIEKGALAQNNRIELLKGILAEKKPRTPLHASLVGIVQRLIDSLLPSEFHSRSQVSITLADSEPEPDIAIVRGVPTDYLSRHPRTGDVCLVIEIAVSSLLTDQYKAEIYAEAGIPNYWIVNLVNSRLEIYSAPTPAAAGLRYANYRQLQPDDLVPVILDNREIGTLRAGHMIPVPPIPC